MLPRRSSVTAAEKLEKAAFPDLGLSLPIPYPPMEATRADQLPAGDDWQFEPKWDGFRCLAFRNGHDVVLQSKAGQPLTRYFPELVEAFQALPHRAFVLDGEIVVTREGQLSFDDLLQRIHPAASRIAKLAHETPATFTAFDLLADSAKKSNLVNQSLMERRTQLEDFFASLPNHPSIQLSPATRDRAIALRWFDDLGRYGLDGVMAKKVMEPYHAGDRAAMVKVKRLKSADCVIGGFRYASKNAHVIGSLLLGLYDSDGLLHFVGFTSSFAKDERMALKKVVEPLRGGGGFSGKSPGGPTRWSKRQSDDWEKLDPVLVCEVRYDYYSQGRFRHGTKFLRWRPDKQPRQCTVDQVQGEPASSVGVMKAFETARKA